MSSSTAHCSTSESRTSYSTQVLINSLPHLISMQSYMRTEYKGSVQQAGICQTINTKLSNPVLLCSNFKLTRASKKKTIQGNKMMLHLPSSHQSTKLLKINVIWKDESTSQANILYRLEGQQYRISSIETSKWWKTWPSDMCFRLPRQGHVPTYLIPFALLRLWVEF